MLNNLKYPFIAFIVAMLFTVLGVALQSFEVSGAPFIVSTMLMAQGVALVWMIVLLVKKRK